MSTHSHDSDVEQPEEEIDQDQEAGEEIGSTDGEGSTFEPEEDPEGHAD